MSVARSYTYRSTHRSNDKTSPDSKVSSSQSSPSGDEDDKYKNRRKTSSVSDSDDEELEIKLKNGVFSNLAADNVDYIKHSKDIPKTAYEQSTVVEE